MKVAKSLVGHGPNGPIYQSAVKVGAKELRRLHGKPEALPKVSGLPSMWNLDNLFANATAAATKTKAQGGMYAPKKAQAYDYEVARNLRNTRSALSGLVGRDLNKKPAGRLTKVKTKTGYPNAHPVPWGRKGEASYMVGGKRILRNKQVMAHEGMHADKSSWRMAQIQSDPKKLAREEARADTLSGTYKQKRLFNPIMQSHTEQNRRAAGYKGRDTTGELGMRAAYIRTRQGQADNAKEFIKVQDKIAAGSKGRIDPEKAYHNTRRAKVIRNATIAGASGGGYGAYLWRENDHRRAHDGKFVSKSMPDCADVHVPGSKGKLRKARGGDEFNWKNGKYPGFRKDLNL